MTKRLNSRQGIPRIPTIPRWRLRRRRNGLPPRPTGRLALPSLAFRIRPIRRSPASNRATVRQDMDSRGTHNPSYRRNSNRHSSSPRKNASAPTSRASLRISCTPVPRNRSKSRVRRPLRNMFLLPRMRSGRKIRAYRHREPLEIPQSRREGTNVPWRQISIQLAGNPISSMRVQFSTRS